MSSEAPDVRRRRESTSADAASTKVTTAVTEGATATQVDAEATATTGAPLVRIRRGPHAGAVFAVPPGTTRIGRGRDCGIVLDHPTVSRHHAVLRRPGTRVLLADTGSLNGTRHNCYPVVTDVPLADGDGIRIGVFHLVFHDRPA